MITPTDQERLLELRLYADKGPSVRRATCLWAVERIEELENLLDLYRRFAAETHWDDCGLYVWSQDYLGRPVPFADHWAGDGLCENCAVVDRGDDPT